MGQCEFPNLALGASFTIGAYGLLKFMNIFHLSYFESLGLTDSIFLPIFLILDRIGLYQILQSAGPFTFSTSDCYRVSNFLTRVL